MIYEVGKKYREGVAYMPESLIFDFLEEGGLLRLVHAGPTDEEIQEIGKGKADFRLVEIQGIIFILAKFGDLPWMYAPYHVDLSAAYTLEKPMDGKGYAIYIILLDTNGIVKVIRRMRLSTRLSVRFAEMVEKQRGTLPRNYEALARLIKSQYTIKDMLGMSTTY
jgi:hypothetical protein